MYKLLSALALASLAVSCPIEVEKARRIQTVAQFPNGTFVEAIAARQNGALLVSANIGQSGLWYVDPNAPENERTTQITTFSRNGTLGITEVTPDLFAVAVGDIDFTTFNFIAGSWEIQLVNLTNFDSCTGNGAIVSNTTAVPDAGVLNGLATLSDREGTILATDHIKGLIWKINTKTGEAEIFLDDPTLKGGPEGQFGVNGIKTIGAKAYFTNTYQQLYARFTTGPGPLDVPEVLAQGGISPEDFALDAHSTAWIGALSNNTLLRIGVDGAEATIAGSMNSTELRGPGAAIFSREHPSLLYIATAGPLAPPVFGAQTEGGKVIAYRTHGLDGFESK